jgi:Na+/H+ antiporter NhaD/arsenite permease-like protein
MVVPVALAISKKLNFSPVAMIIAISVSSNLQGAATLVGDTTSILLGGFANMNFMEFFWMDGKPGIFWGVELGALVSAFVLMYLFRDMKEPVSSRIETQVEDYFPSYLMVGTVVLLIAASFIPEPDGGVLLTVYNMRSGLVCLILFLIGLVRACLREKSHNPFKRVMEEMDYQTLLLLFGLFMVIEGIRSAGVIDLIAQLFYKFGGNNPFMLYTAIVVVSVILSAFIDNIPYVATMIPVIASLAAALQVDPTPLYFGLLSGATLGGNCTPIGASANITGIGILRKAGYEVKNADFFKIGIPFTLGAIIPAYIYIWLVYGI